MLTLPSRTLALAAAAAAACVVRPPLQTAPRAGPRDSVDEDTTCAGTTRADTRPSAAAAHIQGAASSNQAVLPFPCSSSGLRSKQTTGMSAISGARPQRPGGAAPAGVGRARIARMRGGPTSMMDAAPPVDRLTEL